MFGTRIGKVIAVSLLGASVLLTGCNKKTKTELANLREEVGALRDQNAQLETTLSACENQKNSLQTQVGDLQTQLAARPASDPMNGNSGGGGGNYDREPVRITLSGDVLFASGQATIQSKAKPELDGLARQLKGQYAGKDVRIEGHTDSDPIRKSKWPSNEALSQARADAVMEYLANKGVDSGRLSSVGMGSARPKGSKAASRRVEVVVVD